MKFFIQKEDGHFPLDTGYHLECALRDYNFLEIGETHINYRITSKEDLGYLDEHWEGIDPKDVYVGSLEFMNEVFRSLEVKVVPFGIVQDLLPYYYRDIKYSTLGDIRKNHPTNIFIKPYIDKQFSCFALGEGHKGEIRQLLSETATLPDKTQVIISSIEEFKAEYRCLVHNGEIADIRPYIGKWYECGSTPDIDLIKKIVSGWRNAPKAYALDIGVTEDGKTKIVEVNDFWSCGCYGYESTKLIFMITQRYFEIIRKRTTAV